MNPSSVTTTSNIHYGNDCDAPIDMGEDGFESATESEFESSPSSSDNEDINESTISGATNVQDQPETSIAPQRIPSDPNDLHIQFASTFKSPFEGILEKSFESREFKTILNYLSLRLAKNNARWDEEFKKLSNYNFLIENNPRLYADFSTLSQERIKLLGSCLLTSQKDTWAFMIKDPKCVQQYESIVGQIIPQMDNEIVLLFQSLHGYFSSNRLIKRKNELMGLCGKKITHLKTLVPNTAGNLNDFEKIQSLLSRRVHALGKIAEIFYPLFKESKNVNNDTQAIDNTNSQDRNILVNMDVQRLFYSMMKDQFFRLLDPHIKDVRKEWGKLTEEVEKKGKKLPKNSLPFISHNEMEIFLQNVASLVLNFWKTIPYMFHETFYLLNITETLLSRENVAMAKLTPFLSMFNHPMPFYNRIMMKFIRLNMNENFRELLTPHIYFFALYLIQKASNGNAFSLPTCYFQHLLTSSLLLSIKINNDNNYSNLPYALLFEEPFIIYNQSERDLFTLVEDSLFPDRKKLDELISQMEKELLPPWDLQLIRKRDSLSHPKDTDRANDKNRNHPKSFKKVSAVISAKFLESDKSLVK